MQYGISIWDGPDPVPRHRDLISRGAIPSLFYGSIDSFDSTYRYLGPVYPRHRDLISRGAIPSLFYGSIIKTSLPYRYRCETNLIPREYIGTVTAI